MSAPGARGFFLTNDVANRALIPLLRSSVGRRLGRRLAVVTYLGRHSGRPYELVTQYLRDGQTVHIGVGSADRKTWWRNFESARAVRLELAGHSFDAVASATRQGDRASVVAQLAAKPEPSADRHPENTDQVK